MVPIPWKTTRRTLTIEVRGVGFEAPRDGERAFEVPAEVPPVPPKASAAE